MAKLPSCHDYVAEAKGSKQDPHSQEPCGGMSVRVAIYRLGDSWRFCMQGGEDVDVETQRGIMPQSISKEARGNVIWSSVVIQVNLQDSAGS